MDVRADRRLLDVLDGGGVRHHHRVVEDVLHPVGGEHLVDDGRVGGEDVEVVLAAQALLDDLHVQQAEEAAAEAEAQGGRTLGRVGQGRVVDRQFRQRRLELFVVGRVERVDAAEDHRADLLEARDRLLGGVAGERDGVTDLHVRDFADIDDDVTDRAWTEFVLRLHLRREDADFLDDGAHAVIHQLDRLAGLERAGEDADVADDALVGIEQRIEDERAVLRVVELTWRSVPNT